MDDNQRSNVPTDIPGQCNVFNVKEELQYTELDFKSTLHENADIDYTSDQNTSVVKEENTIIDDGNDPILCNGAIEASVEDEWRDSLTPQESLMEHPGTCTMSLQLKMRKECLQSICRVDLRRLDTFQCEVCGVVYTDTHKLLQHVYKMHVKSPQTANEGQQCAMVSVMNDIQRSNMPTIIESMNAAPDIPDQCNVFNIKEELGDTGLDECADINYTSDQNTSFVQQENTIIDDGNDLILCRRVKEASVEDERRESLTPQESLVEHPGTCTKLQTLQLKMRKECLTSICRVDLRRLATVQCEVCDVAYTDTDKLLQHVQEVHEKSPQTANGGQKLTGQETRTKRKKKPERRGQPPLYRCSKCQKMFTRKKNLSSHFACVHATGSHECAECNSTFKCAKYLKIHIHNVHSKRRYECAGCKKIYKAKQDLLNHVRRCFGFGLPTGPARHVRPGIYICDHCHKTFTTKAAIRTHIVCLHAGRSYECGQCDKSFKCKPYLRSHIHMHHAGPARHVRPGIYICDHCHKTFTTKAAIRTHIVCLHAGRSYECGQCDKSFKCKPYLRSHIHMHHADEETQRERQLYRCDKCPQTFKVKSALRVHCTRVHGTGSHRCTKCNSTYKCEAYLLRHILHVHGKEQYECADCKKMFKSRQAMCEHVPCPRGPMSAERQPYRCDKCPKTFKVQGGLRAHCTDVHGTGSHGCTKCNSTYKCKAYLVRHILYVHGQQQYECADCKKMFKSRQAMCQHVPCPRGPMSADSHRQLTCGKCGKGFSSKGSRGKHERRGTCIRSTANKKSKNRKQPNVAIVKEEPADGELELGPVVFQHMDCNYRPYKQEPGLD